MVEYRFCNGNVKNEYLRRSMMEYNFCNGTWQESIPEEVNGGIWLL
jgi:hypothetical protein